MPTSTYLDKRGHRLPSVTQVLGASWSKGDALIAWANREGLEGRSHTAARDAAATVGTIAHELALSGMGGASPDLSGFSESAIKAARIPHLHALGWIDAHDVQGILVEQPLSSGKLGYGGTPDWYGLLDGVLTVLDIKTSKGIYPSHFVQCAAYAALLEDAGHQVERIAVLHLPRTISGHARQHIQEGEKLSRTKEGWQAVLRLYQIQVIIGF